MKEVDVRDIVDLVDVINKTQNPALREKLQGILYAACEVVQKDLKPKKKKSD